MTQYAVSLSSDGLVVRTGTVPRPDLVAVQAESGELAFELSDDIVVEADGRWRWDGTAFVQDAEPEPMLEDVRAAAKASVKQLRDAKTYGGCSTAFGPIDTDQASQLKISGAVQMAMIVGESFTIDWRMADNSLVNLDAAEMAQLGLTVGQHVNLCQQRKNALDAALDACASIAEVEAVDVESGWPT